MPQTFGNALSAAQKKPIAIGYMRRLSVGITSTPTMIIVKNDYKT